MLAQRNKICRLEQKYIENFNNFRVKFLQNLPFFSVNLKKFQHSFLLAVNIVINYVLILVYVYLIIFTINVCKRF